MRKSSGKSFEKAHLHAMYKLLFTFQYWGQNGANYTLLEATIGFTGFEERTAKSLES